MSPLLLQTALDLVEYIQRRQIILLQQESQHLEFFLQIIGLCRVGFRLGLLRQPVVDLLLQLRQLR